MLNDNEKEREKKVKPLKMSFWPRGRTLVEGKRRDLRSLMVELGEIEMGIETPLNFTFMVMVAFELGSLAPLFASISTFSIDANPVMSASQEKGQYHLLGKEEHHNFTHDLISCVRFRRILK